MHTKWVAGQLQLSIMNWQQGKVVTLFANEIDHPEIDPLLKDYIRNALHNLNNK